MIISKAKVCILRAVTYALGYLLDGLLQCALPGAILEEYSEATGGIERSTMDSSGGPLGDTCNTAVARAAVVANLLLDSIQGVGPYF